MSSVVGPVFATTAGILSTLLQTIVIVFVVLATGDLLSRKVALLMPPPEDGDSRRDRVRSRVGGAPVSGGDPVAERRTSGGSSTGLHGSGHAITDPLGAADISAGMPSLYRRADHGRFDHDRFLCRLRQHRADRLPPLAYITISSIQNNLVSPFAYGSGLRLNPLAVLIIVIIGWFLWGPAGAFVAVPLLAAVRVFAERSSTSSRLGEVLSD